MENLIYFGAVFILVSLVYLLFLNRKRLNGKKGIGEAAYVIAKFKLDKKKINLKSIVTTIGFINALIIAFVCAVISAVPLQIIWQLLIGFVLIFGLIYSLYEIYGRILVKKGWQIDEKKNEKTKKKIKK